MESHKRSSCSDYRARARAARSVGGVAEDLCGGGARKDQLLEGARAHARRAQEAEELSPEERQQANRSLQYWFDEDGKMVIKGRLSAQAGALLKKAIELAADELPETATAGGANPPAGVSTVKLPPSQMRRAHALEWIAATIARWQAKSSTWRFAETRLTIPLLRLPLVVRIWLEAAWDDAASVVDLPSSGDCFRRNSVVRTELS
jgi:hypothetical protein